MGRGYTTGQYAQAAARLRAAFPGMAVTTDLICGFPGETEAEFAETLAFVAATGFARIHVFPFSPREGTPAAGMPGPIDPETKRARAARLLALGDATAKAYVEQMLGTFQPVLFEREGPDGPEGYTPQYVRVCAPGGVPGQIQTVRLTGLWAEGAQGELAGHPASVCPVL
jgi:threonylcarbamoyladenosine tRNA methylthiotransferase MtaB